MELYSRRGDCFGCGSCAAACPRGAISMREDEEGFAYPRVDSARCVDCGACARACPARERLAPRRPVEYRALRCRDAGLLRASSSGGAFSLLAEAVLARGGLACGAGFDEAFRVRHQLCEDVAPLRKSKYVQSDMRDCFVPIRRALDAGRELLFCGTPCQCHALRRFLGGNRDGLLLVSLVCRGVQSPGLWADYVTWLERDGPLEAYDFRDKRRLDGGRSVRRTVGGRERAVRADRDGFSLLYIKCLTLRPSCYACPYCTTETDFDFTIGDFWGVGRIAPELDDGRGASLVIARGERALARLEALAQRAILLPCSREDALQPSLCAPARETPLRKLLFRDFARKGPDGRSDISLILRKYAGRPG